MKRLAILVTALIPAITMFAYYGDYGYSSRDEEMSGFAIFLWIVAFICSVIILIRWWKMTDNIKALRSTISGSHRDLAYLAAIGEKEQLEKVALAMLIEKMYSIYNSPLFFWQDERTVRMNRAIKPIIDQVNKLGIEVPGYARNGQTFILYMNELTGKNVS